MADIKVKEDVRERFEYWLRTSYNPAKHLLVLNGTDILSYNRDGNFLNGRSDVVSLNDLSLEWSWGVWGERDYVMATSPSSSRKRFFTVYEKKSLGQLI